MIKILFFRSIFAPNMSFLNICLKGLSDTYKFIDRLDKNVFDITLKIKGYVNPILNKEFELKVDTDIKIVTEISKFNFGKYHNLVNMSNEQNYDLYFYMDHDILINNHLDSNILDKKFILDKNLGIIAFNQKGDVKHNYFDICLLNIEDTRLIVCKSKFNIASGCFLINSHSIYLLHDLPLVSVYGLDEIYIYELLKDKTNIILPDYYVLHPFENNTEYFKLKMFLIDKINKKEITYGKTVEKMHNYFLKSD